MYVQRLQFTAESEAGKSSLYYQAMAVLAALYRHGQICGHDWPLHWESLRLIAQVQTLEGDALDAVHHSAEVCQALAALPPQGMAVQYLGEGASEAVACSCVHSSSFALYTHFLYLGSPVLCLDCGGQVPLYRLPAGALHSQELLSWQSDYRACDSLQMGGELLEAEMTCQLAALDSALTRRGRALCEALTRHIGRPFYYYLYRDEGTDLESESCRPCPSCGQAWIRQLPRLAPFDFQCDRCCLLSNIAFEVGWMGI